MKFKRLLYVVFIVAFSAISMVSMLYAYPYGRIGRSGKQGEFATCSGCHFGPETPDLSLAAPSQMLAGNTVNLHFTVDRNSDTATVTTAGFNLAVSEGTLLGKDETPEECRVPAEGPPPPSNTNVTCISVVDGLNEMSHARPAELVDGKATFNMQFMAPITATGTITIYGSGVAATEGAGAFNNQVHAGAEMFTIEVVDSIDVYLPLIVR